MGKLRFAMVGRRKESAEMGCEQLASLSNLVTIRFLRTVLPCDLFTAKLCKPERWSPTKK